MAANRSEAFNIFGKWPILDIDGNIVLCPTIAAARHLAVLYGIREWPWLQQKEKEAKERVEEQLKEKDGPLKSKHHEEEEAKDEERLKLLESNEEEVCLETLSDVEREIRRRSGVDGFFHDRRVMSCPRPYVVAV